MIKSNTYSIFFSEDTYNEIVKFLDKTNYSSLFILVDEHTKGSCLPILLKKIKKEINLKEICIPFGENNKTLKTCNFVWQKLTEFKADRNSILINLGGGMITDLGGFAAATFKRGMRFINVPTTLLGMVDASVGGKTGVDFIGLKNQIGLFANPELVVIDVDFLETLPKRELNSGMAEIIKYALTYDLELWNSLKKDINLNKKNLKNWIFKAIKIKNEIVLKDPKEQNVRKILNYGHTIGHAIESYFLTTSKNKTLLHGEAIAIGLICETYISMKELSFPESELLNLNKMIASLFNKVVLQKNNYKDFFELMKHDKKNNNGIVLFTLINNITDYKINCSVPNNVIIDALNYYNNDN